MLGLPFFYDQFGNMEYIKKRGLGLVLNYRDMTSEELKDTIFRLLTEKSFDVTAKIQASQFLDQPMSPLETAIWWTHYVLRHKGAPHMRVAGRELDFFTYHSLDVLATLFIALVVILSIIFLCVVKFLKLIHQHAATTRKQKQKTR